METTPSAVSQPFAGFWKRVLAYLIDALLLGVVQSLLAIPILAIAIATSNNPPEDPEDSTMIAALLVGMAFFVIAVSIVVDWLYHALMESSTRQATLGKMALGIVVVDMQGARISFGRATGRHFAKLISSFIIGIGFIMAGFTQQKQALHDILAQCLVMNRRWHG
ncbi:MAG: RDD family protein [Planctomycetaceae bacterium]|nr:MAG: RDD family protein [Planctomycetaceae bacterium]